MRTVLSRLFPHRTAASADGSSSSGGSSGGGGGGGSSGSGGSRRKASRNGDGGDRGGDGRGAEEEEEEEEEEAGEEGAAFTAQCHGMAFRDACVHFFKTCWRVYRVDDGACVRRACVLFPLFFRVVALRTCVSSTARVFFYGLSSTVVC